MNNVLSESAQHSDNIFNTSKIENNNTINHKHIIISITKIINNDPNIQSVQNTNHISDQNTHMNR